jgi:hypothetical protein
MGFRASEELCTRIAPSEVHPSRARTPYPADISSLGSCCSSYVPSLTRWHTESGIQREGCPGETRRHALRMLVSLQLRTVWLGSQAICNIWSFPTTQLAPFSVRCQAMRLSHTSHRVRAAASPFSLGPVCCLRIPGPR